MRGGEGRAGRSDGEFPFASHCAGSPRPIGERDYKQMGEDGRRFKTHTMQCDQAETRAVLYRNMDGDRRGRNADGTS